MDVGKVRTGFDITADQPGLDPGFDVGCLVRGQVKVRSIPLC